MGKVMPYKNFKKLDYVKYMICNKILTVNNKILINVANTMKEY